jgi:hypothetical protein
MRVRVACCALVFSATASAQTARVSGRVVEESRGTPIPNATVRISGAADQVTDSLGRFEFTRVFPQRYIITVASMGYRFTTVEATIERDTTLVIMMIRRVTTLDTVVVRPRYVRIKGTAVDSASGDALMQAQATLYPDGRFAEAVSGTFRFDSVAPGPVTIIVEGAEHLPVRVELDLSRDTSFKVKMSVDSLALRMIAVQVKRLEKRAQSVPYQMRSYNRNLINEHRIMAMGDFLAQHGVVASDWRRSVIAGGAGCYFVDDVKVDKGVVLQQIPELIERVETYKRGGMIRIYTKRYVASLIGRDGLLSMKYIPTGFSPTCS